jgi:hypothetical protein
VLLAGRHLEPDAHRAGQPLERLAGDVELALRRLLPGDMALAGRHELVHRDELPVDECRRAALDDVQPAQLEIDPRGGVTFDEALELHLGAVAAAAAVGECLRVHAAEGEAPLVLHRAGAVRPQEIALVEDGLCDPADGVHGHASACASSRSRTSSQLADPPVER